MTTVTSGTFSFGGNHGVVRLDKVRAAYNGNLESVVHTADMDNGFICFLGEPVSGERELMQVKVPDATSVNTDAVLLIASVPTVYFEGQTMADYYNPAGTPARAYHLEEGDIISITDNVITGTTVVGQWVEPVAGSLKLSASATLPTTRFVGEVIEKGFFGAAQMPITVIRVRKN